MVEETLKSHALPDRFAEVVAQMNFVSERINPLAARMQGLRDEQLRERSAELRSRLSEGRDRDLVKAEAFALVREACRRVWGQPHYDVQLVAAMILDQGWVAEEATGEGKTITCLPAAYMAALEGWRVHIMTVNDYLARRDADFAEPVLALLGVSVAYLAVGADRQARCRAYENDIIYGCHVKFGFDHLRDRFALSGGGKVQGPLDFAIIDEADMVLMDEARTPLIISRPDESGASLEELRKADAVAQGLMSDAEARVPRRDRPPIATPLYGTVPKHDCSVRLTAKGLAAAERLADVGSLRDSANVRWIEMI